MTDPAPSAPTGSVVRLDGPWTHRDVAANGARFHIAEMGDGVFGVEAAARTYFGKSPATLTVNEAARLAAVLPNPVHWGVVRPTAYIARRAALIRSRIAQLSRDQRACTGLRR